MVPRVATHAQFFIGPDALKNYGSLWAGAWFVLLIACANLANLTLARTLGRSREFATRLALGANHWRLLRQIFTESLLLSGVGGLAGWWITKWSIHTWAEATQSRFQVLDYSIDFGIVAYLIAITFIAAVLFSLAPVVRLIQLDRAGTLKGAARGVTAGRRGKYLSLALVAVQMMLAVVLLSGAGVLVRSFTNVVNAEAGVREPENVLIGLVSVRRDKYPSAESRIAFFDTLRAHLSAVPAVESVTIANTVPVDNVAVVPFDLEGQSSPEVRISTVTPLASGPDYFRTVGAGIISGRDFNDGDLPDKAPVAIVNQSFVDRYWSSQSALGKRLRLYYRNQPGPWRTVVGVATNIMQNDATRQTFLPIVYVPFREAPTAKTWIFARLQIPPSEIGATVGTALQKLDSDVTIDDLSTLKASFKFRADRMDIEHEEMGKHAAVAPIFAVIALVLAAIGLYAVVAHSIGQRDKEIGLRIAIGATVQDVRRLVFSEGMLPVAIGLVAGLIASFGVNRVLSSQLVAVSPYDPVTLIVSCMLLVFLAAFGCYVPARRAVTTDPARVLRND